MLQEGAGGDSVGDVSNAASVPTRAPSGLAVRAFGWRHGSQHRLTAVAKLTLELVPGGTMTLAHPLRLEAAEVHHHGQPTRSVRHTGDLAPYLAAVDVVLVGHAHAPAGQRVREQRVRLALHRDRLPLFDKELLVRGDRADTAASPEPWGKMPLVLERALGGLGDAANPLGTGATGGAPPNLVHPSAPAQVACFAPISRFWPARRNLVTPEQRRALERPLPEVSEPFDWTFFQTAPPDQRVPRLVGGEVLILGGLHPERRELLTRLPRLEVMARAAGLGAEAERGQALVADTLWIDADSLCCSVTLRASFAIPTDCDLTQCHVDFAFGLDGAPLAWPEGEVRVAPAERAKGEPALDGTVDLGGAVPRTMQATMSVEAYRVGDPLPFGGVSPRPSPAVAGALPGSPWGPAAPKAVLGPRLAETVAHELPASQEPREETALSTLEHVDAPRPPAVPVEAPVAVAPTAPWASTQAASPRRSEPAASPFASGPEAPPAPVTPPPPPPRTAAKKNIDVYKGFGKR